MKYFLHFTLLLIIAITIGCSSNSNIASGGQSQNSATGNKAISAENKTAENKPTPETIKSPPIDEMPKFKKGETYKSVREKLIKAGWTPFKSKDADKCLEGDERCQGFPEMEACAGTGLGNCRYLWKKGGKTLAIFTISDSPIYDGQEFIKASQQSESDRNDTRWQGKALVHTPPSNVRESPAGKVICVIREKKTIMVQGSTNIADDDGEWIRTNACGKPGVIHSSQINLGN
ncbi:MAG TPA: hypothetical protein PKY82_17070 [Pyrinomonadaceae bacterium]|nr:hypothetical protein [Pyrinomonadaceae bacterium]